MSCMEIIDVSMIILVEISNWIKVGYAAATVFIFLLVIDNAVSVSKRYRLLKKQVIRTVE